jgi:uncharacterized protein (DUF433 family)
MRFERISSHPARMQGMPCIRDTRVTVSAVLGQLAAGRTIDDVVADHPQLEREDVLAALAFAAASFAPDEELRARLQRSIEENREILDRLAR